MGKFQEKVIFHDILVTLHEAHLGIVHMKAFAQMPGGLELIRTLK